jgi:hypothetical protein
MFGGDPMPEKKSASSQPLPADSQQVKELSGQQKLSAATSPEALESRSTLSAELSLAQTDGNSASAVIDVFGGPRVKSVEPIPSDMSLIPTIKLIRDLDDKHIRTQSEAQILLLTFLFYLRKPLSPRVRQSFLDFSEQAIDDYYAAFWLKESAAESLQ